MAYHRSEAGGPKPPNPVAASEPLRRWVPRVYAIVGPDGAGKTTIARGIVHRLARRGIKTRIVWMRSPRIVTLGVLGILRMSRLAKTVRMGDHDDVHVDLGLASGVDEGFLDLPPGRILLDLARKHRSVLVTASSEELIRRKPILSLDPRLARRLRLYAWFADRFGFGQVDSGTTSEAESVSQVSEYLGIGPE